MKEKIILLIKILGFGLNEIVIDIQTNIAIFNTIEFDEEYYKIYLHIFKEDDYEVIVDFDDLTEIDQLSIYKTLSIIYN